MPSNADAWWRRAGADRVGLAGLLAWIAGLGWTITASGLWSDGQPGYRHLPMPLVDAGATALVVMYTMLSTLAVTTLVMRRVTFLPLLAAVALVTPSVWLYGHMVRDFGFSAPAVQFDEIVRACVAAVAAPFLIVPWLVRRPRDEDGWLRRALGRRRTPGHLAIGIALFAVVILQVTFHVTLLVPGAERARMLLEETQAMMLRTDGPEEIDRLVALGALGDSPLAVVVGEPGTGTATLVEAIGKIGVPHAGALAESVFRIEREARGTLFAWEVPGEVKEDRFLAVYDGRGERPRLWVVTPETFVAPRLDAISAFYALSGISSSVWLGGGLVVAWGHRRRPADRHRTPGPRSS